MRSAGMVLCGMVLGLGLGRAVWVDAGSSPSGGPGRTAPKQKRREPEDARIGGGGKTAGATDDGGPSGAAARREKLAARLLMVNGEEHTEGAGFVSRILELAAVPAEEIDPLLRRLAQDKNTDQRFASFLLVRRAMLDPKAAMAFVTEAGGSFDRSGEVMGALIFELGKRDLPAARAALASLKDRELEEGETAITRLLGKRDPREALAFARERENDAAEAEALKSLARSDLSAVAGELEAGNERHEEVVREVAASLLEAGDRPAFEGWANSLKDPTQRAQAWGEAFQKDAAADPKGTAMRAAEWMAGDPEAAGEAAAVAGNLVGIWLKADKGANGEAGAWAASLPEAGWVRDRAVGTVAEIWMEQDTEAASAWIGTMPASAGRDAAAMMLVRRISRDTPGEAFTWAGSIHTPGMREDVLGRVVEEWGRQDPAAAAAAVETLPPGDQASAREALLRVNEADAGGR